MILDAGLAFRPLLASAADSAAPTVAASVWVQTATLKQGSLPRTVVAYGVVQANPAAHNSLMAPLASTVAEVYVRVGQTVAKGEPLVELAPTPQTSAAYAAALSTARVAGDALTRTRQLRAESLATEPQVAAAEKANSDAHEALVALRTQGAAGPSMMRAPAAAVVTALTANTRAIVAEGAPLLELAQANGLVLVVGVVAEQAATIKVGDAAQVTAVGGAPTVSARVSMRGAAVDPINGLVPIEIALPASGLLSGESAQASITTGSVHGYVVPHEAVLVQDTGDTYVVQDVKGAAKTVPIKVLLPAGENDVIDGPLDATAPLILAGAYQLQDGMKVRYSDTAPPTNK
jgi:membrane fusion protein (multidrug efflux system)